ncbi:MAG TPA: efflux RND transporter periplasmic adaptor subunit, partial [Thermoanaerobaculia bacterium]|nr:efflux RND transporter periplasmic adaptor subunit [Thermoanaerobaculia bacterium]
EARSGSLPLEERLSGVVRAENQVAIRPQIEATVVEVLVRSGQSVERGQPLVRLDGEGLLEQLRQAEASLRQAEGGGAEARAQVAEVEAQVSRTRALHAEGLMSDMELETQEAQLQAVRARSEQAAAGVAQARSSVEERRSEMAKTLVRAPVGGRVGQRDAEVGMLAGPGTTLFLVGEFDRLIIEVPLTEKMLAHVAEGTPVEIRAPSLGGAPLRAAVSRISPFLEAGSFSTLGEIDVGNPDGRLRPGMFVTVDVLYGETDRGTLVPTSALWEDPASGGRVVFVLAEPGAVAASGPASRELTARTHPFEPRPIRVRAEGRATAGVEGVEPGDWVVTVGQHLLQQELEGGGEAADQDRAQAQGSDRDRVRTQAWARVRPTTWERVLELQGLQREDLLRSFLDKQRRVARALGAEIPDDPELVERTLRELDEGGAAGGDGPSEGGS